MKQVKIAGALKPAIVQGCMRIGKMSEGELLRLIETDISLGINFFDHADIYGGGDCEELFGKVLKNNPSLREKIVLQSKCGIVIGGRTNYYDFSKEHIIKSAEGSLKRLNTDYLDYFLLHRPDTLMVPEEVEEAFEYLHSSGKVRHFGVSNHTPYQIELLQKSLSFPLEINQLQFGVMASGMVDSGICANTRFDGASDRDGGVLDYCRLKGITIQAWSPFQYGFFDGAFIGNEKFPGLNSLLSEIASAHGVTPTGIAAAWILRHPAGMQVVSGSVSEKRIREIAAGAETELAREEWYLIYRTAGNEIP